MKDSQKLGFNSVLGDDTIVAEVQSSGKRKQLSKDDTIYSKLFKHKNGYVITYKNRSLNGEVWNEELNSDEITRDDKDI